MLPLNPVTDIVGQWDGEAWVSIIVIVLGASTAVLNYLASGKQEARLERIVRPLSDANKQLTKTAKPLGTTLKSLTDIVSKDLDLLKSETRRNSEKLDTVVGKLTDMRTGGD